MAFILSLNLKQFIIWKVFKCDNGKEKDTSLKISVIYNTVYYFKFSI